MARNRTQASVAFAALQAFIAAAAEPGLAALLR
jgi:hypothetical protein